MSKGRTMSYAILLARLLVLAGLLASPGAFAQSYPSRNVTIVVTSNPGALTDVLSRAIGQRLSQMWNQSIVIENKPGGAYAIAGTAAATSAPDGHTLLATQTACSRSSRISRRTGPGSRPTSCR
jgi:tripartite-type tricarboxylate transporter receptor subunit TctC